MELGDQSGGFGVVTGLLNVDTNNSRGLFKPCLVTVAEALIYLSVCLSIFLYLSIYHLYLSISIYIYKFLSILSISINLYVQLFYLSMANYFYLSVYLSLSIYFYPLLSITVYLHLFLLFLFLSIYPCLYSTAVTVSAQHNRTCVARRARKHYLCFSPQHHSCKQTQTNLGSNIAVSIAPSGDVLNEQITATRRLVPQ